jgi:hypothetical protein
MGTGLKLTYKHDREIKKLCERYGVPNFWVLGSVRETVETFRYEARQYIF